MFIQDNSGSVTKKQRERAIQAFLGVEDSLDQRLAEYLVKHSPVGHFGVSESILIDCRVFLSWLREKARVLDIPYHLSELHDDGYIEDAEYEVMKELFGE